MIIKIIKNLQFAVNKIINFILPVRSNFEIVKNLDEKTLYSLPKSPGIKENDWVYPLFHYSDKRVKAIIWELKYRENTLPLETIGKMLYEEIIQVMSDIILFDNDAEFLILPIPMTDNAKAERGYNQSELIAKSIIENDLERKLLYAPQWFRKIKETPKQSHSESKEDRIKNLIDCFWADERAINKYVFLIDDVVTTGSTLNEARNTLLKAGAKNVFAFTIAH